MDPAPRSPHAAFPFPGTLTSRRSSVLLDEKDGRVVVGLRSEVEFVLDDQAEVEDVFEWLSSLRLVPVPSAGGPASTSGLLGETARG